MKPTIGLLLLGDTETQDDEVAELGFRLKNAIMLKKMHYYKLLTGETFFTTVTADLNQRALMVLFYVACKWKLIY